MLGFIITKKVRKSQFSYLFVQRNIFVENKDEFIEICFAYDKLCYFPYYAYCILTAGDDVNVIK